MNIFRSQLVVSSVILSVLVVGIFYWSTSRKTSAAVTPCVHNLMIIDECKINWANVNNKTINDAPTINDLKHELESYSIQYNWKNGVPVCPDGGIYTVGRLGVPAKCSIGGPGHSFQP